MGTSTQPPRPNTQIHYPVFTEHNQAMPAGQLKPAAWRKLTTSYPDPRVVEAILGICQFGARIGYEAHRGPVRIYGNLTSAEDSPEIVTAEIEKELSKHRLQSFQTMATLPTYFTASPLGLTDKSDGSKRRIHHLSYPTNSTTSINSGIPEIYGTITYSTIEEAIAAIQKLGRSCLLVKRDFESAFRHIPVSPLDTPLLGFHWKDQYYSELFLPFGLRTAPYLFNLFAEVFHWVLENEFTNEGKRVEIIHYLDDFLIIAPPEACPEGYSRKFATICERVGLTIKTSKNEEGVVASFAGIELDTKNMVIRLPKTKLEKARTTVQTATKATSLSLLELQKITGYLNFVGTVVPLGRTFLRRLYNMQLYFPEHGRHLRRRISTGAQKDLTWWLKILRMEPERSIELRDRKVITLWSDASGAKGLGAFYVQGRQKQPGGPESQNQTQRDKFPEPQRGAAFSISLPRYITRTREHINTKEMRAVEQALLHWGRTWKHHRVVIHTDNRAVAHGIENRTIRGASMDVLRRCLLLAAENDLEIEVKWISTKENSLADALSCFDFNKIANIAPQLLFPSTSLRDHGFLTYGRLASRQ